MYGPTRYLVRYFGVWQLRRWKGLTLHLDDWPKSKTPQADSVITMGGFVINANSDGQYVIGSQTLVPGSSAIIASSTTYSLAPSATAIVVNGVFTLLCRVQQASSGGAAAITTIGASTVTANSAGDYVIDSQTLVPGSAITSAGTTYSLAPSSAPTPNADQTLRPVITIDGSAITADSASQYMMGLQTLKAGGPAIVDEETTYSLPASGTHLVVSWQTSTLSENVESRSITAVSSAGQTLGGSSAVGSSSISVSSSEGNHILVFDNGSRVLSWMVLLGVCVAFIKDFNVHDVQL